MNYSNIYMKKNTEQLVEEGEKLKMYRKLMGLKQKEMAKEMNTKQSNYCRMEQGRLDSNERLDKITKMFKDWRDAEIERLNEQIEYLKAL